MNSIADNQSGTQESYQAKILVVDDDALNQRMMQVLLKREGYQVDTASGGMAALEAIKLQKYDIVFMDLQMPGIDGIETSRRIREWENGDRHTFIVALTASYLPEKGQELFEAGIDNYVAKPFELEHIHRLLRYTVNAQSVNSNQSPPGHEGSLHGVLDIQKGVEQVGGDVAAYKELLAEFVRELPQRIQAIQQFFDRMDWVEMGRAAHNLNGIAANLGALQLSELAKRLDRHSVDGYTELIDHLITEIRLTGTKVQDASSDFLANGKVSVKSL